jgi:hypothetical protein
METRNSGWRRGAFVGLVVGAGVGAAAWSNLFGSDVVVLQFLAAVPPFLLSVLLNAPEPLQALVIVAWWTMVGAVIGRVLGLKAGGEILAILVLVILIPAHVSSQTAIERELGTASEAVEGLTRELFGK